MPAHEQDRAQVGELIRQIQEVTGNSVEVAFVNQGYTGDKPAAAAEGYGIRLEVVKLSSAKRGFGWMPRFRRLVPDYEPLVERLLGLHFVAFVTLPAHRFVIFMVRNP